MERKGYFMIYLHTGNMYNTINESIGIVFDDYISTRSRIYKNICVYADNKNNTKQDRLIYATPNN
jgi:hypothetical protein